MYTLPKRASCKSLSKEDERIRPDIMNNSLSKCRKEMSGKCEKCLAHCLDCKCSETTEFYSYAYLKDHALIFVEKLGKDVVINTLKQIISDLEKDDNDLK